LRAHYNEQILERIAYPIFCEIFLGTPETNSKIALCVLLKNLMKFKIFALADGMGSLPGHLSKDLDIRLNSPVTKIIPLGEKGPCEVEVGGVSPMSLEFDAVIMAIPLPRVPELVEKLPDELTQYFDTIVYAPSIVVALALEDQAQNTSMINNLLRSEFDILGTVVFDHHKSPRRVPSGKAMATAILREQASRKLFDQSDEKITDQVLNEMDNLFAKFSSKLMFFRIYRWEYGALQLPPGQLTKRKSVHHILDEGVNHIYFAGESFPISSLEASFNSGLNAANQIIMKMKNEELE
jgi:oxygen-dependent protoporphyrinogen oxidase